MSDHKPGCEALGGYGHGVGPCTCGADTTSAAPSERELFEALQEFADDPSLLQRQLDGKSYIYTRIQGMWEGWQAARRAPQPVTLEPLTDERQAFEAFWRREMNTEAMDLARTNYPMTPPEKQQYLCHETERAWITWQERAHGIT